jgi:electron transfer flavoprotein beta subunit
LNIAVCVKQVPDTEARLAVAADRTRIEEQGISFILNPYDEHAVEEALRIKEKAGGTVTVFCLGPQRAEEAVRTALAMGADRAVHLSDPAFLGSDEEGGALALARAIGRESFDLVLTGRVAIDDASAQVGGRLAEKLGWPHVTAVTKLELSEGRAVAHREIDGGGEVVEVTLPAVLTAQRGLNQPRYPKIPDIMKARRKEVAKTAPADLGLEAALVGAAGSRTRVLGLAAAPSRAAGKIVPGEPAEAARKLAALLREEAKVI